MNDYKSLYLNDVLAIIDRVAMEAMMTPCLEGKKADGTGRSLAEVSAYNSMVAHNNEGIRDFVSQLRNALTREDDHND